MKNKLLVYSLAILLLSFKPVLAVAFEQGQMLGVVWEVESLSDDRGDPIRFIDLDIEFKPYWIAANGGFRFDDGVGLGAGTGYIEDGHAYFQLNIQSFFVIMEIELATGNGTATLYKVGVREPIDTGNLYLAYLQQFN